MLTALSIALMIAPTAHHRMRVRDHVKEQLLRVVSKLAIAGLVLLAGAVSATLYLITDVVHGSTPASVVAAAFGIGVMVLWFVVPLLYRDT